MKQIYINGTRADIPKLPIAINWEYMDLATPDKKYSPFTSTLTLPFTATNKSLMGYGDVPGADLTKIRSVPYVDLIIGAMKFIKSGTFKVMSSSKEGYQGTITGRNTYIEAIEGYTLDEAITDAAATFTYASYTAAIDALRSGAITAVNKGFILPRTLEGAISSSIWTIYSAGNGHTHEVWISAYALLKAMIDEGVISLNVWEDDDFVAIEDSLLYAHLCKLYTPCWNWVLYDGGAAWTLELATGQRLINGEVIDRDIFTTFGGRSSWEFIKDIAQLFCCAIYQDETDITLIPLNHITSTGAIDLSGKAKMVKKYFAIPGHGSSNYVSYENTDNLSESFARVTITSPVVPPTEKSLMTLDLMLPGQLYVNQYSKNFFNTDYNANGSLKDKPLLLYDDGDTDYTTITHGTDTETDILLKVLTYMDLAPWWAVYQLIATKGEAYDADISIDPYTLTKLRPWLLVRINELGGLFYLSKITGFDPDSGRMAKCQIVKWASASYFLSTEVLLFTYNGQTLTLNVVSNIPWSASFTGSNISMDKTSGTGNDTITFTCNNDTGFVTMVTFNFGGDEIEVNVGMDDIILNSVAAIGTQNQSSAFSPAPTFSATVTDVGSRRIYWAIYKAAVLVSSGYELFTTVAGTNNYSFTGLTTPAVVGTDYTFKIGYKSGTYGVSSAQFEIVIPV